jgi:hypothetical protein
LGETGSQDDTETSGQCDQERHEDS